jgi:hypothetical protein
MAERHRCQIDLMIDEMVAAGKSEQDSVTLSAAIASDFQRDDCARCDHWALSQ